MRKQSGNSGTFLNEATRLLTLFVALHQGSPHKLVGVISVLWKILDRLAAFQESPDLIDRANAFGLKCHDHPPMIAQTAGSGPHSVGNADLVQAHVALDNTVT